LPNSAVYQTAPIANMTMPATSTASQFTVCIFPRA
jgi:hypothetical protein